MALAQNSYMAGSTSPSSLIHTACFFLSSGFIAVLNSADLLVSFAAGVTEAFSAAVANETRNVKRKNKFANIFISSMYKDLL